jgi:hypothetical protein
MSLATGLPLAWILGQRDVYGAATLGNQFLILNMSGAGDPLNAGAPGTYGVEGVHHNTQPSMVPTKTTFGSQEATAAAPWATLPAWVRERTAFVHHRSYTNAHPNFFKELTLFGASKNSAGNGQEQFPSMFAGALAEGLQTVQREPIVLSNIGSRVTFEGREQPVVRPSALSAMLSSTTNETLKELESLRELQLDEMYAELRAVGTPAQIEFLDRYANSRAQLRQVRERVGALLQGETVWADDPAGQISATLAMIQLGISPLIITRIPFGGDNHADPALTREAEETNSGVATIASLFSSLDAAGLKDKVTFANFNVFGRTLKVVRNGDGRNHNQNHHTTLLIGPNIRGGVAGGIEPLGNDFAATALDSNTGAAGAAGSGDIKAEESLESVTLTLGKALGVSDEVMRKRIVGGKPINSVLV